MLVMNKDHTLKVKVTKVVCVYIRLNEDPICQTIQFSLKLTGNGCNCHKVVKSKRLL